MQEKIDISKKRGGPKNRPVHPHRSSSNLQAATILSLQRTLGNRAVQRLFQPGVTQADFYTAQSGTYNAKSTDEEVDNKNSEEMSGSHIDSSSTKRVSDHRKLDFDQAENSIKVSPLASPPTSTTYPTGIEKTEVIQHKLHFGARYKHTLKSSNRKLEGMHVTEKVTNVKDDFETNLPKVELGKHIAVINKNNEISDKIWLSFGAIAPAVKRLRRKKKPGESLLGSKVDHQELYYWKNSRPQGWKKFTDVKIEQHLYDLPGLYVVTIDNDKTAKEEKFTPFPSKSSKKE